LTTQEMKLDEQWAALEFADVELEDARLNRRCQELAVALGQQPMTYINQACEDWADTKAAYRFFGNTKKVTPAGISAPHQQRTVERMSQHPLVLAVQDTTFFNYTHHPHTEGLGEIGTKKQQQRGFGLHSTLAVTPAGVPLGTLTQQYFTRPIGEPAHTPRELQQLPIEAKESYHWLEAFEQTLALTPAEVEVVTVCDRDADIYELFVLAEEKKAGLVIRASADRVLAEKEVRKLWAKAAQQPLAGHLTLQITSNQQRPARQATVSVRFTPVKLKPPWRPHQKKLPPVTLNAILVREDDPPVEVDEPIEWLLLTNTSVQNFDEAVRVVGWYSCRWQIEVYHKILKSGCTVEDCRLQKAERLHNYIALMSVVAWRLHWMTYLHRTDPDLPCTVILTATEWQALSMRIHRTTSLPSTPPTVRQAVRWIAQLGGFLGRKQDGEPGITVMWRGWQRLQDMADTWYLVNEQSQFVGNR
jgi:Transposase DNA-binding/Transposase Tn5 dimerisation domain